MPCLTGGPTSPRLEEVRAEFSLTALAYNLRQAIDIVGMVRLTEAAAT
jgi:hypothetical protein